MSAAPRLVRGALAAIVLTLAATTAEAYRPLVTEDTGTLDPGRVEMQAGGDVARDGDDSAWSARAVAALGLVTRVEGRVEAALGALDVAGERGRAGVLDSLVGVKYRFVDETPGWPAGLLAATVRLPTGDADRGLGEREVDVTALAVASKTFGALTAIVNAGRVFVTRDRALDAWIANLAVDYRLDPRFSLVAEVVSTVGARDAADAAILRGGGIARLSPRLAIDAGIGVGLTRGAPDAQATVGLTLGF